MRRQLYVIVGPTATGKTAYAQRLAAMINGEIVNADSRQMYRGLDIISGKDLENDAKFHKINDISGFTIGYFVQAHKGGVPIWMYDCVDISRQITAHDFRECAQFVVANIFNRGKVPILVGGTYFYLRSFLYDVESYHVAPNPQLRKDLEGASVSSLQNILNSHDPKWLSSMNESDRVNPRRLMRKIEIASVRDASVLDTDHADDTSSYASFLSDSEVVCIGKKALSSTDYLQIIHERVRKRIENGAIDEYIKLYNQYPDPALPGYTTIGCKEIRQYLDKEISRTELIHGWTTREIQYAKRQMTFMKLDPHIDWSH